MPNNTTIEMVKCLPSVAFAISQLKNGSEDAQMHSFYLQRLLDLIVGANAEQAPALASPNAVFTEAWKSRAEQGVYVKSIEFEFDITCKLGGGYVVQLLHIDVEQRTFNTN